MSPARDLDERFADWVDGRLSAADRDRLATELTADPVLQSAAEDYRATVELLRRSLAGDESAPEDLVDTIVAATDGLDGLPGGAVRRRAWGMWLGLATAAGLLLYVAMPWGGGGDSVRDVARSNDRLDDTLAGPAAPNEGKSSPATDRAFRGKAKQSADFEESARAAGEPEARRQSGVQHGRAKTRDLGEAKDEQNKQVQRATKMLKEEAPSESAMAVLEALEVELRNQRASVKPEAVQPPAAGLEEVEGAKRGAAEFERLERRAEKTLGKAGEPESVTSNAPPQLVMVVPVPEGAAPPAKAPAPPAGGVRARGNAKGGGAAGAMPGLPRFLTAPEVMGEARLGNQLQLSVSPTSTEALASSLAGVLAAGDTGGAYQPFPGDQLFTVRGTEQELPLYFTRLQSHLAGQGSQLQVQWAQPGAVLPQDVVKQVGQVLLAQKGQTEVDDKQIAALRSVLLVLRQQAAAATQRDK